MLRLVFSVCLVIAGCGENPDKAAERSPAAAATEAPAERVISLAPHLTELSFTAGAGDQLVGVVEFSDFPAEARALPRVGDAFRLDYEVIVALEPDLILAWESGNPVNVRARLRDLGFRVVALEPRGLDSIAEHLRYIGALTGTENVANVAATKYEAQLTQLRERYRDAAKISVYYQISARPVLTVSRRHVIDQAIELCGGRNVFADLNELTPAVSVEAVLEASPEVIMVSSPEVEATQMPESLSVWNRWSTVPAVRNGNLYVVDAHLIARSSTRILRGVGQICAHLDTARLKGADVGL